MERLDFIILGATGFTGKYTAINLVKLCKLPDYTHLKWGICGRSKEKINDLMKELEIIGARTSEITTIICDVLSGDLSNVISRTKIVINCTGPNTILSEPIVKTCIENSTDYVDISAELYHMLDIYKKYNKSAEQANVLIIPSCGFSSIPVASGLIYLENNFQGTLKSVQCYTRLDIPLRAYVPWANNCLINSGTWESMIHVFHKLPEHAQLKNELFPENPYEPEPQELKRSLFHVHNRKVWFTYPGPDADVIDISERYLQKSEGAKPYHFKMYATMPCFLQIIVVTTAIFSYYYMSRLKCFRNLLIKHPRLFSAGYATHKGPSSKNARETVFTMTFIGKGLDKNGIQKKMIAKVTGSDPGYETTSTLLIISALTILKERSKMPKGGVIAPAAAFHGTNIVETVKTLKCLQFDIESS
ncbi:saccharopine dehydrogenase-like oxidoreductase [Amyelois transitella]|uniref:saccharopine dehydrogenase-like oxidoreductase n=1 Tax=Amyelois transitella TaxID=680683 RepID=UPI00067AEAB7|nr:saccharopine dehydrogenase-like oxidoreductase [Amyelois transitella]